MSESEKKKKTASKTAATKKAAQASAPEKAVTKKTATKKVAAKASSSKKTAAKKIVSKKTTSKATPEKTSAAKKSATADESGSISADKTKSKKTIDRKTASKKTGKAADESVNKPVANKKVAKKAVAKKVQDDIAEAAEKPDFDQDDDIDSNDLPSGLSKAPVPYERNAGHYMDVSQLDHFSKKLAEWKQQLMEEVDRTVGHMKDDATNFPDPNDRATQEEEFSLELRTRDRERKLIKKINEAQKRIDDDEYGYCETCGIEIGVSRLEARPTAELCIDCKTLEEIRERQTA